MPPLNNLLYEFWDTLVGHLALTAYLLAVTNERAVWRRLKKLPPLLLSLLAAVLLTAMQEKGVECRLEVLYPVVAVDMDVWDFVRCLGILIDNAVEAALDVEQPWVEIVLLAQDGQVFLRVSNPYTNIISPIQLPCPSILRGGACFLFSFPAESMHPFAPRSQVTAHWLMWLHQSLMPIRFGKRFRLYTVLL